MPNAAEHIKRKLPSMYHQFKQLADIDITEEPMEVGPTTHYIMGGVHVDADTQMSGCQGCSLPANARPESMAPIGSAAIRFPIFWSSANAPANSRRNSRRKIPRPNRQRSRSTWTRAKRRAIRKQRRRKSVLVQRDLQEVMQTMSASSEREAKCVGPGKFEEILGKRANRVGVTGNRDFNPGWHTALDLKNLLTISEAITRAALERKESRGAQFREDYPEKDERFAKVNTMIRKAADGSCKSDWSRCRKCRDYLKQVIEEMK